MAGGRGHTPLFDLIREADRAEFLRRASGGARAAPPPPGAAGKPQVRVLPAEPRSPRPAGEPSRRGEPAPAPRAIPAPTAASAPTAGADEPAPERWFDSRRVVSVPMVHVWTAVAAALAVGLVLWFVAFRAGEAAGRRTMEERLQAFLAEKESAAPGVEDPLRRDAGSGQGGANGGAAAGGSQKPDGASTQRQASDQPPSVSPTPATAPGTADPRIAGHNYLILAGSLSREDAEAALAFLRANGFEAAVSPVDRGGSGANNRGRFVLYSTLGIPGEEYSKQWKLRDEHAKEARRLGAVWKREHRGTTDFAQAYWARYSP